jgi:NAD(P) transhydrogenase subunit beta
MIQHVENVVYLIAATLFILGLKKLGSPRTALRGNALAAIGMLLAIVAVLVGLETESPNLILIFGALVVGSAFGTVAAQRVKMTAMPQMVALFNGLGGAGSALVAASDLLGSTEAPAAMKSVPIVLSTLIGTLTLTGSLLAFGKLQGLVTGRPVTYPFQKACNAILLVAALVLGYMVVSEPLATTPFVALVVVSGLLGVTSVLPIGGADMPVVISLLNSYSGLAACATGFVLQNNALIISGSLVGASGIILTKIMCKAMNRSLANVLFSAFGQAPAGPAGAAAEGGVQKTYRSASPDEAAMILDTAMLVVVVPGYGMAVAQAQHQVRELDKELQKRGVEVLYGIHPVAGRMPGHMNVLLAEADVPYEQLAEMDAINPQFARADVAIVIGANDVTNPAARTDTASPIYGMPILDVDKARSVMVLKRSMGAGFAGIDNDLFYKENTLMVFGDAKDTVGKLVSSLKEM